MPLCVVKRLFVASKCRVYDTKSTGLGFKRRESARIMHGYGTDKFRLSI